MPNGTARPTSLIQPQRPMPQAALPEAAPMQGQPNPQQLQQLLALLALLMQQGQAPPAQQVDAMLPPGVM